MAGQGFVSLHQRAQHCDRHCACRHSLCPSWDALPRDAYLRDGGRYRSPACVLRNRMIAADTLSERAASGALAPVDLQHRGGIDAGSTGPPDVAGNATLGAIYPAVLGRSAPAPSCAA